MIRMLLKKNSTISWILFTTYIAVFLVGAAFPLAYKNMFIHVSHAICIIPVVFEALLGRDKHIKVYIISFLSLLIGMIGRYIIEFSEISNSTNFTIVNIVAFLGLLPLIYVFTYHAYCKKVK